MQPKREEILEVIYRVIRKTLKNDTLILTADIKLIDDLQADWMDEADILMTLDESYPGIYIINFVFDGRNLGDLADFICNAKPAEEQQEEHA